MVNSSKKDLIYIGYVLLLLFMFLVIFVLISNEVRKNELINFDHTVITFVQSYISPKLTGIMLGFTFLGSVGWISITAVVGVIVLLIKKKWSLTLFLVLSSGVGALVNHLLKSIFKRARPDIHPLIMEHGFSFPSGHSMGSFIFYGTFAYVILHYATKKGWKISGIIVMAIVIFFIGLSRIYLGVHYPSDIIGGFAAGGAWLTICVLLFRYYEYRNNN